MRVVKRGVPASEKKGQVTCHSCKSEMEYTQQDLTHSPTSDQRDPEYTLRCPVCLTDLRVHAPR